MEKFEVTAMNKKILAAIFLLIGFFIAFDYFVDLYTEYLWFNSLNLGSVFVKMLMYKFTNFAIFFFIPFAILILNKYALYKASHEFLGEPLKYPLWIDLFISLIFAIVASRNWLNLVYFINSVDFNIKDPIFNLDASFYVFKLPFIQTIFAVITATILLTISISVVYYIFIFRWVKSFEEFKELFPHAGYVHMAILISLFFILASIYFYLVRYDVLTAPTHEIVICGYTDVNVRIPALTIACFVSIIIAALSFYFIYHRNPEKLLLIYIAFFVFLIFLLVVIPGMVQKFKVEPNELAVEEKYIKYGINYTRFAYGLNVKRISYPVSEVLNPEVIKKNWEVFENIRIWDHRPLLDVYRQIQQIRTYYYINDVDVDRYYLDGKYTQVMISARELSVDLLPPNAKTWINQHLIYTHGYGVVASPVNIVSEGGLPDLIVKDIPPKGKIKVVRPEIYFGEVTNNYVVVNTLQKEFDYPAGEENVFTTYNGTAGVKLDSFLKRWLFSIKLRDVNLMLSNYITSESRILLHRNIKERVYTIAPFLKYDKDPYIAVINGRLYWIIDAYTTLSKFPYSATYEDFNYIRNPVKVFIDAYNGTVEFYVIQKEPVINTLIKAFPELFKQKEEMDSEKIKHIRYPVGLLEIQALIYSVYHMEDVKTFYNREDIWEIPMELFEDVKINMEPYYVITVLPGCNKSEFILMLPFTPKGRDNIIAWLAARCDENYGELILYEFPKGKLVYGPMQIEARIDQDAEISKLFTLWGQAGSKVIRGNLLVIPVGGSIIYVEPIYLKAEKAQIPELRGVILAHGSHLKMYPSLNDAVKALIEKGAEITERKERTLKYEDLVKLAIETYKKAIEEITKGNWSGFGEMFERLGKILEDLNKTRTRGVGG